MDFDFSKSASIRSRKEVCVNPSAEDIVLIVGTVPGVSDVVLGNSGTVMTVRLWPVTYHQMANKGIPVAFPAALYIHEVSQDQDKVLKIMANAEAILQENVFSFFSKAVCPARRLLPSLLPWTPACLGLVKNPMTILFYHS